MKEIAAAVVFWILVTWIAGLILHALECTGIKTVKIRQLRSTEAYWDERRQIYDAVKIRQLRDIHPRWRRPPLSYLWLPLFLLTASAVVFAAPVLLPVYLFNRWRRGSGSPAEREFDPQGRPVPP